MKKQLLTFILLIASCFVLNAQGSTFLTGFVMDADGESTYDIILLVNGDTYEFTTGTDGTLNEIIDPGFDFTDDLSIEILYESCTGDLQLASYEYFINDLNEVEIIWFNIEYCEGEDIEGCTDPTATNYNPEATIDDGSCEFFGNAENDLCADATPLENGVILVNNTNAFVNEGMDGDCWGFGSGEAEQTSVWYSFTTPEEPVTVLIESMYDGTNTLTDTQFGLYLECGDAMVECDGNTGEGLMAMFYFACGDLLPNTDYILQIDGWNSDSGTCLLDFQMELADCVLNEGCTDCAASNYDPEADIDNGTCEYVTYCEEGTYVSINLLTGYWASEITFYINGELISFPCVSNLSNNSEYSTYVCLPDGCITVDMYDSFGDGWNGGILFITVGEESYEFGLDTGTYGGGVFLIGEGDCEDIYGCTYVDACNYNSEALYNDGSCTWPGCTDPAAINYNSLAGCANDSLCYYPLDCDDNETPVGVSAWLWTNTTDSIIGEYTFELTDAEGNIYLEIENEYYLEFYQEICLPDEGCYTITMTYSEDVDYMEGNIYVYGLDSELYINAYLSSESNVLTFDFSLDGSCGEIYGCTDEFACNYNADASYEDWSCTYPGCMDEAALNYNPWAGCADNELCEYPFGCDEDQTVATIYLCTYSNGQNVNMEILNEDGEVVASYTDLGNNFIMQEDICLDLEGCYTVVMTNTEETGWYGGYYWVSVDGIIISTEFLDYDLEEETALFSLDGTCGPVAGCTYEYACNYNPEATVDDWSCTYPGCMDPEATNYNAFAGCEDNSLCVYPLDCDEDQTVATIYICTYSNGQNVNMEILNEDGEVVASYTDLGNNIIMQEDICLDLEGCYTVVMTNTEETGWYGGYYWVSVDGIIISTEYLDYDLEEEIAIFSLDGTCGPVSGCTYEEACNFNPEATIEDWSCTYPGCMDPAANNYNAFAGCEDNTLCVYPLDCEDNEAAIGISAWLWANDTSEGSYSFELANEDGDVFLSFENDFYLEFYEEICLPNQGCYTITMTYSEEVEWVDGNISIWGLDSEININAYVSGESNEITYIFSLDGSCGEIYGCDDESACNYNSDATQNDWSCTYPGCMDEEALNYNPFAGCTDDELCEYPEPCEANTVVMNLLTDNYGYEMSWILYTGSGTEFEAVADGNGYDSNTNYTDLLCLEDGCYLLEMYDSFGDGWNYGGFEGSISFSLDGEILFEGTLEDGSYGFVYFGINSDCSGEDVYGCTDPAAYNYDANATIDDGSCEYEEDIYGCTDSDAINYDPNATIDDDSCLYSEFIFGCTDPVAWNYNPFANVEDGSCEYEEEIYGCTDPDALNYDANATIDDGSCFYFEFVLGCTDPEALNFNAEATIDDGSCVYDEEEIDCSAFFGIFEIILEEDMVIIVNTSTGEDLNFFWDFGDGTTSTDPFPIHFYEEDGIYTVCLTVYNDDESCSDTFCTDIVYFSQELIMDGADDIGNEDGNDGFTINVISEEDAETISVVENEIFAFSLYPNPANDIINIQLEEVTNNMTITIQDLSGRIISREALNDNTLQISVNNFANGIYVLSLQDEENVYTKRFEIIR